MDIKDELLYIRKRKQLLGVFGLINTLRGLGYPADKTELLLKEYDEAEKLIELDSLRELEEKVTSEMWHLLDQRIFRGSERLSEEEKLELRLLVKSLRNWELDMSRLELSSKEREEATTRMFSVVGEVVEIDFDNDDIEEVKEIVREVREEERKPNKISTKKKGRPRKVKKKEEEEEMDFGRYSNFKMYISLKRV